ncbi:MULTISPECIES: cobyrinate a,c-diamide synthase [Dehalococcoides]|jgi:cobyrinic acid a,c-diamide synthase|uniref:Cobyrinate a,c-diamide synthase n=1 Tax=Dehalococcoides mccartyi TaxID=61435 RepID=A0A142V828_9CHLR|nr:MULTISPECIES: cobyrinate a,c-diamide synthase [Dehalococcoides]AGG05783.1 cobyrinic acid A,C-diamide synthase [Dehalococcoides mccartyi DCMB5]AMU85922.1 cobyrinic acid a,c-diamide synthase [Dehalococcoides mccartyi]AQX74071.1 cobyrinic acid a,c-diamide synthase [Dehalococcoides mccartyi]AQY72585.1 cobyrinic acid a,c-diamide synthase [Dehalococcoides mccartyi]PKH45977.1 cobyrinic acid a,c-diamide synthase [Dehalococcoides mccartyi]
MNFPRIVIAGVSSSSGKTTISSGLTAALAQRGHKVAAYKCGPDYIDPGYLTLASNNPCHNLDSWMLSKDAMTEVFFHGLKNRDIALVEGVMGLYDGYGGERPGGSTAEIARLLSAPVILLVNISHMAESAAAIVLGYKNLDPRINIAGVILNQAGSTRHYEICRKAIEKYASTPVIGYLLRNKDLVIPERHLGLKTTSEGGELETFIQNLATRIENTIDIDRILEIARNAPPLPEKPLPCLFPETPACPVTRIAVAKDEAFSFYYQANLDMLSDWGAELCYFSPVHDTCLPPDIGGIYIGGGFPEIMAAELSANQPMKDTLTKAAADGMPIYAECGGLMYLSEAIEDFDSTKYLMLGLLPGISVMQKKLHRLGYTRAAVQNDNILSAKGTELRGHIFHWSKLPSPQTKPAYTLLEPAEFVGQNEGFIIGGSTNVLASYLHLHFGTNPDLAKNFIRISKDFCTI